MDTNFYPFHYLVLFAILIFGSTLFVLLGAFPLARFGVVLVSSVVYILWGAFYHSYSERLSCSIFLEYALLAVFVVVLFAFLLELV